MKIGGFQKVTLIDYPGQLAANLFSVGCNFLCLYCHNPELVSENQKTAQSALLREKEFFTLPGKGLLEGVLITGGEPTIQDDLPEFIKKIKELGYSVKLDTNGTNPEMLED